MERSIVHRPLPEPTRAAVHGRDDSLSLNAAAYLAIRDRIVRLELAPGSAIDERKLAEEMELGLTPVRHGLRRLALENLVVIRPRRGTLVADLNPADLSRLFEMRLELEALAARLAAERITSTQARALTQLADETRLAQRQADSLRNGAAPTPHALADLNDRLMRLDQRMHRQLAEAAQNPFLLETLEWLYAHVLRLWYTGLPRVRSLGRSMEEHCAVAAAVLAGDSDGAAALMRAHVRHFQDAFLESTVAPTVPECVPAP